MVRCLLPITGVSGLCRRKSDGNRKHGATEFVMLELPRFAVRDASVVIKHSEQQGRAAIAGTISLDDFDWSPKGQVGPEADMQSLHAFEV